MSVPLELDALRDEVARRGSTVYLVTVGEDAHPHLVAMTVDWIGGEIIGGAGRRTAENVRRHPDVSLFWPAGPGGDYSLIVDGLAELRATDGAVDVAVRPSSAVLHRSPAASGEGPRCLPVLES